MATIKLNARDYLEKLNELLGQEHPAIAIAPFQVTGSGSGYMWPEGNEGEALAAYQQVSAEIATKYEYDPSLD